MAQSAIPNTETGGAETGNLRVVALVTAYNEEQTIGAVLDALKNATRIDAIHVVDDASEDATRKEALSRGVDVTSLSDRVPVGEAIMSHLDVVQDECLLVWCDADLVRLQGAYIDALVERYLEGDVSQSLSSRGLPPNWPGLFRTTPFQWGWKTLFGPISGERVMLRSDFANAITLARKVGWRETMSGYGIVLFLNWYLARYGKGSAITYFDELRQRQKYQKWGRGAGLQMIAQWLQFTRVWLKIRLNEGKLKKLAALTPQGVGASREKTLKAA